MSRRRFVSGGRIVIVVSVPSLQESLGRLLVAGRRTDWKGPAGVPPAPARGGACRKMDSLAWLEPMREGSCCPLYLNSSNVLKSTPALRRPRIRRIVEAQLMFGSSTPWK